MKMKKFLVALTALFATASSAFADNSQVVVINGQEVQKVATKITLSGDNATVTFSDGTSQTADMSAVTIYLNVATDIRRVETFSFNGIVGDELMLSNLTDGIGIELYDASGRKVQTATVSGTTLSMNVSSLRSGIYLLKAGNQIVKFMKK